MRNEKSAAVGDEGQPEWEDFMDAEDFINDEDKFNVSGRLVLLFPKIDVNPADGFVSEDELIDWNLHQAENEVMHRTQRELEVHDKNKDGYVSFQEYEPPSWVKASGTHRFTLLNADIVCILVCVWFYTFIGSIWRDHIWCSYVICSMW